ncbi:hypothetical protein MJN47_31530, partial [Salmonella enterica subsp. enterica serovar Lubbock]|nr:hypothetical protein [Salmonella enterica subsp. enterica serovar Lubbock]
GDHHWLMRLALRFWQQGDKRLFQRRAMGFCPQLLRAAGCQYLAGVRKGENDIAVGNLIGANIFNLAIVLGLPALIAPGEINPLA